MTDRSKHKLKIPASLVFLVLANLVPLFGVLAWEWKIYPVMLMFWLENIIVGFFFILRILTAGTDRGKSPPLFRLAGAVFFTFHFGIFTMVHGMFVFVLFSDWLDNIENVSFELILSVISEYQLGWAIVALAISHGFSYINNYIGNGEYRTTGILVLAFRPYIRVAILHLTVLFGGMVVIAVNEPLFGLVVLILLKIVVDAWAHLVEHGELVLPFRKS